MSHRPCQGSASSTLVAVNNQLAINSHHFLLNTPQLILAIFPECRATAQTDNNLTDQACLLLSILTRSPFVEQISMRLNPTWHGIDLHWAYSDLLPSIYRHTGYRRTACDVLHDALIRFAISSSPGRVEQPHAYLRTIVRNLLIDGYQEQTRFLPLVDEDSGEDHTLDQVAAPSTEHLIDMQQRLTILLNIIDHMPARCKEVFLLFRIDGLTQHDIAEKLGISVNMVQKHIMRAMLDLLEARDLIN